MSRSVLVFRTGHLGDTVCAMPAFHLLRRHFSADSLILLCDTPRNKKVPAREVCESLGIFDRILTYQSGCGFLTAFSVLSRIRSAQPDIVVVLPQAREEERSLKRKLALFRWCGVSDIRGSCFSSVSHDWHDNEPTRLVKMLGAIGLEGEKPPYDIPVNPDARTSVIERLRECGVAPERPFIVFCGGGAVATQRWPLARYAAALEAITRQVSWPVVAIGNASEIERYRREISPVLSTLRLMHPATGVSELFELCRLATVYFGNDTGPMHVSAAVGCPVVAVMSARNAPGMWDPDIEPRLVIRQRTECEGCFLSECVVEQHRCMSSISVDRVVAEALLFIRSLQAVRRHLSPA